MIPSYPLEIANKLVVVQPFETFYRGGSLRNLGDPITSTVSLEDYFRAHFLIYLLGSVDLSDTNIGVSSIGKFRLFDNEDAFCGLTTPKRTIKSFFVPFVSVAFDWPHYREKTEETFAEKMRRLIRSFHEKKQEILTYAKIRNLPDSVIFPILERIDTLSRFDFQEGVSFMHFYSYLYPEMAEGLDALNTIVSRILRRNVDHGISLFFISRLISFWTLAEEDKNELSSWIEQYIPE